MQKYFSLRGFPESPQPVGILLDLEPGIHLLLLTLLNLIVTVERDVQQIPDASGFYDHMRRMSCHHFSLDIVEHIIKVANIKKV
jgi:hypothetical protein